MSLYSRFFICLLLHSRIIPNKSEVSSCRISIHGGQNILSPSSIPRRLDNLLEIITNGHSRCTYYHQWIPNLTFAQYPQKRVAQYHWKYHRITGKLNLSERLVFVLTQPLPFRHWWTKWYWVVDNLLLKYTPHLWYHPACIAIYFSCHGNVFLVVPIAWVFAPLPDILNQFW